MATLFAIAATIVIAGWLWFFVVRPILEDYGIIRVDAGSESVNHSQIVMSSIQEDDSANERTDDADGRRPSLNDLECPRLRLDRTKQAALEVMVYNGWTTDEVRSALKGQNSDIGAEVKVVRQRLGIDPPERTLRVKDERGERVIPI